MKIIIDMQECCSVMLTNIAGFSLTFFFRNLRNNEISWAIEDASEAFTGLTSLTKLYVFKIFIYDL